MWKRTLKGPSGSGDRPPPAVTFFAAYYYYYFINGQMSGNAEGPGGPGRLPRPGEVHETLQGQALKTVAHPRAGEHPLETCGLHQRWGGGGGGGGGGG